MFIKETIVLNLSDRVQNLVQPSSTAEYVLSGDRHHFLIHKAKLQAKYIFETHGQEGGQVGTHIK